MRIAIGGFQHETNTFAPSKATWNDFVAGGGWPAMVSGHAMFAAVAGANMPIAGFIAAAQARQHTLLPTTWCSASPSAHVTEDAFERIADLIVSGIRKAMPIDAVYLDLHGAMVAEHLDDGEGEILQRVRALVGPAIPVVASLDLHANITNAMVAQADALVAYRTYPHIDMAETGARAFVLLQRRLDGEPREKVAVRRIPYLMPLCWQSTDLQPAKGLYNQVGALEQTHAGDLTSVSFATGFPAADFPQCGPVVLAYAPTQAAADRAAEALAKSVLDAEPGFAGTLYDPDGAVLHAMELATRSGKPIVIADTQDNPGAGGNSDTTGILRALIRHHAQRAVIGLIVDPEAALAAHAAGVGSTVHLRLGGKSAIPGDAPLDADFVVETLSDGKFDATGPFYRGFHMDLGPCACLRINDVRVVVASAKVQLADQAMFRFIGIEPTEQAILVLKSSAHFRADFTPIAEQILVCAAPGPMISDTALLPWKRLQAGMRIAPMGAPFRLM
ncbi:MAG: microcystin degradation protein MlrC [Burkholderiaceae bacterium]|jgi:microcystin degradation protein MlrC